MSLSFIKIILLRGQDNGGHLMVNFHHPSVLSLLFPLVHADEER